MQRRHRFLSIVLGLSWATALSQGATIAALDAPVYTRPSAFGPATAILHMGSIVSIQPAAGERSECWLKASWGTKPSRIGFLRCEDVREVLADPAPTADVRSQEPIDRFLSAVGAERYSRMATDEKNLQFLFNNNRLDENDAQVREVFREALRLADPYKTFRTGFLPWVADPRVSALTDHASRPLMHKVELLLEHAGAIERTGGLVPYYLGLKEIPASEARAQLVARVEKASGGAEIYADAIAASARGSAKAQPLSADCQEQLRMSLRAAAGKERAKVVRIFELYAFAPLSDAELGEYVRILESDDWHWMNGIARSLVLNDAETVGSAVSDALARIRKTPVAGSAREFYERGVQLIDDGKDREAIQYLNQAIALRPDYAIAYYKRGNAYRSLDQAHPAMNDYTEAVRYDPTMALAYVNRAVCYRFLGQPRRALQDLDRAIQANPDVSNGWAERGVTNDVIGNYTQAVADASQAIRLLPMDGALWVYRGMTKGKLREWQGSLEDCRVGMKLGLSQENLADAYECEGWSSEGTGRFQDALKDYNKYLGLYPGDAWTHCQRSAVLDKLGRSGEAKADRGYCAAAQSIH